MFQHTAAQRRLHLVRSNLVEEIGKFQHTAAQRRLPAAERSDLAKGLLFQHTAAQRRLPTQLVPLSMSLIVSTHSRAEAAASATVVTSLAIF